jgi:ubiquinone/menaquinone biosynthesis C-methylase UbiE
MSVQVQGAPGPPAFAPIAHDLRDTVIEHYERRSESLDTPAGLVTLDTNSVLAARRGRLLLRLLAEQGAGPIEGRKVLDLGAGFGALALYFAHLGAEVVAVDPNEQRLQVAAEIAGRRGLAVSAVIAHAEALPLPDSSIDLIVANNCLSYIVEEDASRQALEEMLRVLRPGGWLVVRNPNRLHPRDAFTGLPLVGMLGPSLARRVVARLGRHRSEARMRSPGGSVRQLRTAGFSEVRWRTRPGPTRGSRLAPFYHVLARRPDAGPRGARRQPRPGR